MGRNEWKKKHYSMGRMIYSSEMVPLNQRKQSEQFVAAHSFRFTDSTHSPCQYKVDTRQRAYSGSSRIHMAGVPWRALFSGNRISASSRLFIVRFLSARPAESTRLTDPGCPMARRVTRGTGRVTRGPVLLRQAKPQPPKTEPDETQQPRSAALFPGSSVVLT